MRAVINFPLATVVDSPGHHSRDCRPGPHDSYSGAHDQTINKLVRTSRSSCRNLAEPTSEEIAKRNGHSGVKVRKILKMRRADFARNSDRRRGRFAPRRFHRDKAVVSPSDAVIT